MAEDHNSDSHETGEGRASPSPSASQTDMSLLSYEMESTESNAVSANVAALLYISHFLSAWNSRAFEFGAFLFLSTIYPQTLLPASVYALVRACSAASLSPWVGRFIDRSERLHVVRISIVGQRAAVAFSCGVLFWMLQFGSRPPMGLWSSGALTVLTLLACVEKLCAVMNTIAVEREWVVIIAGEKEDRLRTMNSQMRRIDLFCKLIAPLLLAFVDSASTKIAITATGAMTASSILVEYYAIARVYKTVPQLREPKMNATDIGPQSTPLRARLGQALKGTQAYLQHPTFLPSFSLSLLYLTVLSFSGQMITYLVAMGMQSSTIGVLRGISAICELSATWFAPRIMRRIGPIRSGIWFINWQIFCVSIACACLWSNFSAIAAAAGAVSAVIASRIGLWGFDLSVQIIIQEEVEAEHRGTFSSQEFAFQNAFEMLSFASTIAFARPTQFKWPTTISAAAVAGAGILYTAFVRARRGHLVHLSDCVDRRAKSISVARQHGWQQISQSDGEGR